MNRWQDIFMELLPTMMLYMGMSFMFRGIVEPELETRLRRKLMGWDFAFCLQRDS